MYEFNVDVWRSYLTDGEIYCEIIPNRYGCGVKVPDGVILGEDSKGNMYLNGKPAHIAYKRDSEIIDERNNASLLRIAREHGLID